MKVRNRSAAWSAKERNLGTWDADAFEGRRIFHENGGEPEVSMDELRGVVSLLSVLKGAKSADELREYYETGRDALILAVQGSAPSSGQKHVYIRRVLKMAYALRSMEILSGEPATGLDWKASPRLDQAVRLAMSEMFALGQLARHEQITIYHLLWALLKAPQIQQLDPRFSHLAQETAEHIRRLPVTPFRQYSGTRLEENIGQVIGVAKQEAQRRGLFRIRPALVMYAIVKTHASELHPLLDRTLSAHELEVAIERGLST